MNDNDNDMIELTGEALQGVAGGNTFAFGSGLARKFVDSGKGMLKLPNIKDGSFLVGNSEIFPLSYWTKERNWLGKHSFESLTPAIRYNGGKGLPLNRDGLYF